VRRRRKRTWLEASGDLGLVPARLSGPKARWAMWGNGTNSRVSGADTNQIT
jgi:hypothetical protein